ncbi:MAG: PAS domain S-box protein [Chloroflexota bacterium]
MDDVTKINALERELAAQKEANRRLQAENEALAAQLQFTEFSVEHAGDRIFRLLKDGSVDYVNRSAWESLGYTREELLSRTIFDLNPDIRAFWDDIWELIKREGVVIDEGTQTKKDGTAIPVEVTSAYQVFDGKEYIYAFSRDISERIKTRQRLFKQQKALEQALSKLQTVQDHSEYAILFLDPDLNLIMANRSALDMWGYTDEFISKNPSFKELIEFNRYKSVYDVTEEKWDAYVEHRLTTVRAGDTPRQEMIRKDGRVLSYEGISLPDGSRMLTYYDITNRKEAERQIKEREQQLQQTIALMTVPIAITRVDNNRIQYCNEAFVDIMGDFESIEAGEIFPNFYYREVDRQKVKALLAE